MTSVPAGTEWSQAVAVEAVRAELPEGGDANFWNSTTSDISSHRPSSASIMGMILTKALVR
jgi:hypothetical protein